MLENPENFSGDFHKLKSEHCRTSRLPMLLGAYQSPFTTRWLGDHVIRLAG